MVMVNEIRAGSTLKAKQPSSIIKKIAEFVGFDEVIEKQLEIKLRCGVNVVGALGVKFLEIVFENPNIPNILLPIEKCDIVEFPGRIVLNDFDYIPDEWIYA